jgi:hypothetical protein
LDAGSYADDYPGLCFEAVDAHSLRLSVCGRHHLTLSNRQFAAMLMPYLLRVMMFVSTEKFQKQ